MRLRQLIALFVSALPAAGMAAGTFPHVPILPPESMDWIRSEDYPAQAIRSNESAAVYVRVVVTPKGKAESCTPIVQTKSQTLADLSCRLLMERAVFRPAEDGPGHPVYGTFMRWVNWTTASRAGTVPSSDWVAKVLPADMEIAVKALPSELGKSVDMYVALSLGTDGTPSGCAPIATQPTRPAALVAVACQQLSARPWSALTEPSGQPVASVQQVLVRFSTAG
jgi:hypothetical protein